MRRRRGDSFLYCVRSGAASVTSHKVASFASTLTTAACLLLIGCLIAIGWNVQVNLKQFQADNTVVAFVEDRLTLDQAKSIENSLRFTPGVEDVTFISRTEVFDAYKEMHADENTRHLTETVFRHRYSIQLYRFSDYDQIVADIAAIPGIADIKADSTVANGFAAIQRTLLILGAFLGIIFLSVSILIMTNTIKLTTIARKEEIEVMKMMGAYDSFVQTPFIVEGCIIGLFGSLLAFAASYGAYSALIGLLGGTGAGSIVIITPFYTIAGPMLAILLVLGISVGICGSSMATRKHVKI